MEEQVSVWTYRQDTMLSGSVLKTDTLESRTLSEHHIAWLKILSPPPGQCEPQEHKFKKGSHFIH